jgi:phosphatidylinositol alpha 1,6-mannosyltransferase
MFALWSRHGHVKAIAQSFLSTYSRHVKVAVVTESFLPQINGVTNSVVRLLETLHDEGHQAMVIAPTTPGDEHLGYVVHRSPSFPLMRFPVGVPHRALQATLDEFSPDVVHVAAPFLLGRKALAVSARMGIPTVAVYQTDIAGYLQRYGVGFARPLLDRMVASAHTLATRTLAPTPLAAAHLREIGVGNVHVWGRGVDSSLFHPARRGGPGARALRESLSPHGEIVIGYVGRLAVEKQVARLAELFGLPGVRFVIVGDGPERARLENDFARHPVTFLGQLEGEALADAYAALDVFVHFGTEETFGQTIQEAQATGLAVVAPARGGPLHLIDDGRTGFLTGHGTHRTAKSVVAELVGDAALRARLGESARRSVRGRTWSAINRELLDHYHSVIGADELTAAQAS